jgi:NADH-quinone oxidoreductase subunit A
MAQNYVSIFLFLSVVGLLIGAMLLGARIVRAKRLDSARQADTELGFDSNTGSGRRSTGHSIVIGMLFAVFALALIFLFPWATEFKALGIFGLIEMMVFLGIPIVGFIWAWKKGTIGWV